MIGFDRSAFVAGPDLSGLRKSKRKPRVRSLHDEGLPERPIKKFKPDKRTPVRRINYETNLSKALNKEARPAASGWDLRGQGN
jgi:hypothetical protein